ncbi:hypothetical protein C8J57DRAFT_1507221 [Mycena rebaudengoi]|nr:hypothetical protein C8J57DRAFT_1507221 [Mycena rebaudengoi]
MAPQRVSCYSSYYATFAAFVSANVSPAVFSSLWFASCTSAFACTHLSCRVHSLIVRLCIHSPCPALLEDCIALQMASISCLVFRCSAFLSLVPAVIGQSLAAHANSPVVDSPHLTSSTASRPASVTKAASFRGPSAPAPSSLRTYRSRNTDDTYQPSSYLLPLDCLTLPVRPFFRNERLAHLYSSRDASAARPRLHIHAAAKCCCRPLARANSTYLHTSSLLCALTDPAYIHLVPSWLSDAAIPPPRRPMHADGRKIRTCTRNAFRFQPHSLRSTLTLRNHSTFAGDRYASRASSSAQTALRPPTQPRASHS